MKEIFAAYQLQHGSETGISKFCELKPKWCITVGAATTHSVCVCTAHQNVKLMLASSPTKEDYKIVKTVCDLESKNCTLHRCEIYSGKPLQQFLESSFEASDPEATTKFKQWVHMIETHQKPSR